MKFLEAKDRLKVLAKGRYHSLSYELTELKSGDLRVKCWAYVDPSISTEGSNWKDVLIEMQIKLIDSSETPDEEI